MNFTNILNKEKAKLNYALFDKIRSIFILQNILGILTRKKLLEIIKYNNKIQRILYINFETYKEYSEKYSLIELEIIPINDKYEEFININEKNKEYYHIYFDDNKNEIKRNKLIEGDKVKKIIIKIEHQIKSFFSLFYKCHNIKSMNFKKFYRNNIVSMECMFNDCSSLKEIKFSCFNTENVTNMDGMFIGCSSLKKLDFLALTPKK